MKLQKKRVQILLDPTNNWIYEHFKKFKLNKKLHNRYKIEISHNIGKKGKKDILFIIGYTKKISLKKLRHFKKKLIIHESYLPKGRGFSPVKHQILKKIYKIKCCLIDCEEKIDSGNIYDSEYLHVRKTDLYDDIKLKQYLITVKLIISFLKKYPITKSVKQKGKPTYFRKLNANDDKINPLKNIKSQFDILRSTDYKNHQNYFYLNNKKYFIRISKSKI